MGRRRRKKRGSQSRRRLALAFLAVLATTAIGLVGLWRVSRPKQEATFRFPTPAGARGARHREIEPAERAALESLLEQAEDAGATSPHPRRSGS